MRYVFYLLLTSAIAGAMELEPEKQPTPPRNIYQAIDSDNHELIEYHVHLSGHGVHNIRSIRDYLNRSLDKYYVVVSVVFLVQAPWHQLSQK